MRKLIKLDEVRREIHLIERETAKVMGSMLLNRSEFNLLKSFIASNGSIIEKQQLINDGWPGRVVGENSLAVAIMKLRKKLEVLSLEVEINNLPGEGYVFINSTLIEFSSSLDEVEQISDVTPPAQVNKKEDRADVLSIVGQTEANDIAVTISLKEKVENYIKNKCSIKFLFESLLLLFFACFTFFMLYREAFDCFTCFGEIYDK